MWCVLAIISVIGASTCGYFYFSQDICIKTDYSLDNSTEINWEEFPGECIWLLLGFLLLIFSSIIFTLSHMFFNCELK